MSSLRKKQYQALWGLLLLFVPISGFNQCPPQLGVKAVLNSRNVQQIRQLCHQLEDCPDVQDSLALSWHMLGAYLYNQYHLDSLSKAIDASHKALALREQLKDSISAIDLGKSNNNLGVFYTESLEFFQAEKYLKKAVDIYKEINLKRYSKSSWRLSSVYLEIGDFEKGLLHLNIANQIAIESADQALHANCLLQFGRIHYRQQLFRRAVDSLEKAAIIYHQLGDQENLLRVYTTIGNNYNFIAELSKALPRYQKAAEISEAIGDDYMLCMNSNHLSFIYRKFNQLGLAEKLSKQAEKIALDNNYKALQAQSCNTLAEVYLAQKNYTKAKEYYQKAVDILIGIDQKEAGTIGSQQLKNCTNKPDLLTYLKDLGRCNTALYKASSDKEALQNALENYLLADQLIDLMRQEHQGQTSKLFWRQQAKPIYEAALEVCYELQDYTYAFHFFEKSKAILLLDALLSANARSLVPDSIAGRELQLKARLIQARERLEQSTEAKARVGIQEEVLALQKELEDLLRRLSEQYPEYHDVKYATNVVSLEEARATIKEEAHLLLHWFYGEEAVYAMPIGQKATALMRLPNKMALDSLARVFVAQFDERSQIANQPQQFGHLAHALYQTSLQAIVEHPDFQNTQSLTILPDGLINYLSFDALLSAAPENSAIDRYPYLINRYHINYGYSATILQQQGQTPPPQQAIHLLGFAPFAIQGTDQYPTLNFEQDELAYAQEELQGRYLLDREATTEQFTKLGGTYPIIHLSTHGITDNNPSKSHIAFHDKPLYLPELYAMSLPSNLIVLSACQTSRGQDWDGEGIMSLARGFTFAGTSSLISSLWNVNAQSTGIILADFYQKLYDGQSKSKALHQAKRAYLNNPDIDLALKSPYHWAGHVFLGSDNPLMIARQSNWTIWGGAAGLLLGFIAAFIFRRSRKASVNH